jgi:hypothetical protein
MTTLASLLHASGYDKTAIHAVVTAPLGDSPATARERVTAVARNYYMQYLAIQLGRFQFDLNRPRIKPDELQQAEALINGKLGNEPLDNARLANLLESLVNDTVARHNSSSMTWGDFYQYEFTTQDGITIRAEDMMKALIRSNSMHFGANASIYHHSFNDVEYKTLSMHHLIARILIARKFPLEGVNAFGIRVNDKDIERMRDVASRITTMRDPQLMGFFQQNAHHNIKQKLMLVCKELLGEKANLSQIHALQSQLMRDNFSPDMYNKEWRSVLVEMHEGLQWISTPYGNTPQAGIHVH